MILSNERAEFKRATVELKGEIVDRTSSAVIEMVTDVDHTPAVEVAGAAFCDSFHIGDMRLGEEEHEQVCMEDSAEFQEDCIDDGGAEVAKAVTCESFYIGEEDPCEEEHSSNIGKDFAWNTKAAEFSPMFEESNKFAELWDLLHSGSARGCVTFESDKVVYSSWKHVELYRFEHGQSMSSLHEVVHTSQQHMKLYRFVRTDLSDCDFDDSEDSYTRNSDAYIRQSGGLKSSRFSSVDSSARNADACFAIRHNLDDTFPDSFNLNACFSDNDSLPDSFNYSVSITDPAPSCLVFLFSEICCAELFTVQPIFE